MANYMSRHTGAQIDQAVAAVLAGNAGSGGGVAVDETLTVSGAAADAKATGEKISQLSEDIANNKVALANMTIEGFLRVGGYENVKDKAELHAGKFASTGDWDSSAKKTKIKFNDGTAFNFYALTVAEGERYKIKTWCGGSLYGCLLVNAAEHIIADYPKPKPSVADNYEIEFTIPSGVTTLYVNETVSQAEKFAIEKENLSVPMFEKIDDHLFGKKLACVGDSITEATNPDGGYFKNYAELAAERHNMTVYKDGKGGSTMTNIESNIPPFSAERYLNVPADYDILTIWFGWNDAAYAQIGTIDDTENTTYYGAYKKVLEYFITTYPTKKIGLIVPYGNASVEPFRVAVRALSEMYGVPCLDLADGKQCSLLWGMENEAQLARRAALTYDGTHPNQVGHEYLSTMYEEFIKRL
jgi:lysophospholipase L1-like esterase